MRIFHIPAYTDNYIWVIQSGSDISVIDPGDASPVKELINNNNLNLVDILLTHHHFDHVGGTLELKEQIDGKVYGPVGDIEGIDIHVIENETIKTLDEVAIELGVSRPQICVAWVASHPEVTSVLSGAEKPEHVEENFKGTELQLPAEVLRKLNTAANDYTTQVAQQKTESS